MMHVFKATNKKPRSIHIVADTEIGAREFAFASGFSRKPEKLRMERISYARISASLRRLLSYNFCGRLATETGAHVFHWVIINEHGIRLESLWERRPENIDMFMFTL